MECVHQQDLVSSTGKEEYARIVVFKRSKDLAVL